MWTPVSFGIMRLLQEFLVGFWDQPKELQLSKANSLELELILEKKCIGHDLLYFVLLTMSYWLLLLHLLLIIKFSHLFICIFHLFDLAPSVSSALKNNKHAVHCVFIQSNRRSCCSRGAYDSHVLYVFFSNNKSTINTSGNLTFFWSTISISIQIWH